MFKAGELSSLDFKSFSILSPLVRLRGRNGGLSLAIGLRASCAIGAKVVSLRSTLSTFRWFRWFGWIGLPIYMQCRFGGRLVSLYTCNADSVGF